jgi:hypothetical protein
VITTGKPGAFAALYDHLRRTRLDDVTSIDLRLQPIVSPLTPEHPVVLWSRLDRARLTIMFDLPIGTDSITIKVADTLLSWSAVRVRGQVVEFDLNEPSAAQAADGGPITVEVDGMSTQPSYTWPYQIEAIRHRLDKASQRDRLPGIANLPDKDADLYALLRQLEQTLIFDPVSAWRVARPGAEPPADDDGITVSWQDLDWDRIRRDSRYTGYLGRNPRGDASPTDIQVILAAIAKRLGEVGIPLDSHASPVYDEDDLSREAETEVTTDDENAQDQHDDEVARRTLPITTRTRMAFTRFVKRYAAATRDNAFVEELGPVVAVTNAAFFNHLLTQLLERDVVDRPEPPTRRWPFGACCGANLPAPGCSPASTPPSDP